MADSHYRNMKRMEFVYHDDFLTLDERQVALADRTNDTFKGRPIG